MVTKHIYSLKCYGINLDTFHHKSILVTQISKSKRANPKFSFLCLALLKLLFTQASIWLYAKDSKKVSKFKVSYQFTIKFVT